MSVVSVMTGRLLRRGLSSLLALAIAIGVFEMLQPIIAKSLGGAKAMATLLQSLPPAFQALVRTQPQFIALAGLPGYLSLGFSHPLFLVLTAAGLISFAARGLAGEMERGTIQLALARPVSRAKIYAARVAGVIVVALVLAIAGPLGTVIGMLLFQPKGALHYPYLGTTVIAAAVLFWAMGGLALLSSAALDSAGEAVAWVTGALAIFYFIDYFAALWSVLKPLDPLSIFAYYNPGPALVHGTLGLTDMLVLLGVGTVAAIAGLVIFVRRDLPT